MVFKLNELFTAIVLFWVSLHLFSGCVTTTESLLQETKVIGMPVREPVRITENRKAGDVNLRANLSFNNKNSIDTQSDKHTMVNEQGFFQVDEVPGENYYYEQPNVNIYEFEGNNISWKLPDLQTRIEVDAAVSDHFALTGGINFAETDGETLFSQTIGLAFFGEKNNWGYRFDANLSFYDMTVSADYVVIEETDFPKKVIFLSEKRTDSYKDLAFGFTMNSNRRDWLINLFFNYTLGWQTLYNFESKAVKDIQPTFPFLIPAEIHEDFKFFEAYHSFTGGIYKNTFDIGRIIVGARFTKFTDTKSRFTLPDFFIQYELTL